MRQIQHAPVKLDDAGVGPGADGPFLSIRDGRIAIGSLGTIGYASCTLPDFEAMEPLSIG